MGFYYIRNFSGIKKVLLKEIGTYFTKYVLKAFYILLCILLVSAMQKAQGQDAIFSQYYSSSLYLNPAFAATEPTITGSFNSRTQWKSVVTPYSTSQASLVIPIFRSSNKFQNIGGIGLSFYNNKAGEIGLNTIGVNVNAAYVVQLNEYNNIITGIQLGFIQKTIDFSKGQWGSQFDPINGFNSSVDPGEYNFVSSILYPDVAFGVLYYNNPRRDITETGKSFYFGASAYHFNRPNESVIKDQGSMLPALYKFTLGGEYSLNATWNVSPNVLIAMQNTAIQVNVGAYATYSFGNSESEQFIIPNRVIAGTWYRFSDSYIGSLGFGNKFYMVGFSYDMNSSSLRLNSEAKGARAYEISIKISSPKIVKTQRVYQTPRI